MLRLTQDNYYSLEADNEYMSCSQLQNFTACESMALAKLRGEYIPSPSPALTQGQYIHSWNEGTMKEFAAEHPEMFKKDGGLKAEYLLLNEMIASLEADPFCMAMLSGVKEEIFTGELFGMPWKIRVDSWRFDLNRIVDLKTVKAIDEKYWNMAKGYKVNFIEHWRYLSRMAVYTEIVSQTMNEIPSFYIVAVSKESPPNKAIISLYDPKRYPNDEDTRQDELEAIRGQMTRIHLLKKGMLKPIECGACEWCRKTKRIIKAVHWTDV